jgi:hypothetical protein
MASTSTALVKAREHLARLHSRVQSLKGKGEQAVGEAVSTALVAGGAAGAGFVDEKWGTDDGSGAKIAMVHGVPTNLLLGVAAMGATFMGIAGKNSQHGYDAAKGFIAGYTYHLGRAAAKKTA